MQAFTIESFAGKQMYRPYSRQNCSWEQIIDILKKVDPTRPHAFITRVCVFTKGLPRVDRSTGEIVIEPGDMAVTIVEFRLTGVMADTG